MTQYTPRWYQAEAASAFFSFVQDPTNRGKAPLLAMPTGTGKSVVIADIVSQAMRSWPSTRVVMLTHVKELVAQNAEKLTDYWPEAPLGIWSSGLRKSEWNAACVYAGIATVQRNPENLGRRDILLIDEAHRVAPNEAAAYKAVISVLRQLNPNMVICGLTATPYRMGQGLLTEATVKRGSDEKIPPLFTDIAYDLTSLDNFNRLVDEGFLAPLVSRPATTQIDVSQVRTRAGEFVQSDLADQVNTPDKIRKVVDEIIEYGDDRNSWLVFASGNKNAELLAAEITARGYSAVAVTESTANRDNIVAAYKAGEIRCLVNNDIFTTGFDHPPLDLIAVVRATKSVPLWVQMLGRGTRPHPSKENCLVLDFAGNTRRLGPINDPHIPNPKGKGNAQDAPVKICTGCGAFLHASARVCGNCGLEFLGLQNITQQASTLELMVRDEKVFEWRDLDHVNYKFEDNRFTKQEALTIRYKAKSGETFWHNFVFKGEASTSTVREWWLLHAAAPVPANNAEAKARLHQLRTPLAVKIMKSSRANNPKVVDYAFT